MKGFKTITGRGYYGMLVFTRVTKNILWDEDLRTEVFEYDDKLKPGFILDTSDVFEDYYLVRFFTGEKEYHWGIDLFEKKEENNLTYLQK